jgi:hypothetical protein
MTREFKVPIAAPSIIKEGGTSTQYLMADGSVVTFSAQGIQGTQGADGAQGAQGIQGIQGTQGTQGTTGLQGVQGVFNVNSIQPTPPYNGQVWVNTNDGRTYVYDDTEWFEAYGNYQGLQGLTGIQGPIGTSIAATYDTDQGVISGQVFS